MNDLFAISEKLRFVVDSQVRADLAVQNLMEVAKKLGSLPAMDTSIENLEWTIRFDPTWPEKAKELSDLVNEVQAVLNEYGFDRYGTEVVNPGRSAANLRQ